VLERLGKGRWDGGIEGEGDFTPGAGLNEEQSGRLIKFLTMQAVEQAGAELFADKNPNKSDREVIDFADDVLSYFASKSEICREGFEELRAIDALTTAAGYGRDRIKIDTSVVRGLEYYTGPVFEAELLFDVTNEKGQKVQFGSVGGGGRYDGLVSRFMGQPVPATGFSIGVSRLMTALKNLGKLGAAEISGPILITIMDRDRIGDYAKMAQELRTELNPLGPDNQPLGPTIPVELFQGNPKDFPKQLRYADRRGSPIAIIQGGNEKQEGKLIVKDLIEGKRIAETITDNAEWREAKAGEHLVDESELVVTVKRILAEQASDTAADADNGQG